MSTRIFVGKKVAKGKRELSFSDALIFAASLGCKWAAFDADGQLWGYVSKPNRGDGMWHYVYGNHGHLLGTFKLEKHLWGALLIDLRASND